MVSNILCAIDGSEHSDKALGMAVEFAKRHDAQLCFIHVLMNGLGLDALDQLGQHADLRDIVMQESERLSKFIYATAGPHSVPYTPPVGSETLLRIGEVLTHDAIVKAAANGVEKATSTIVDGDPADQILAHAKTLNADLLVMGHRGLGRLRMFLGGSVANKVMQLSQCTCVAVK